MKFFNIRNLVTLFSLSSGLSMTNGTSRGYRNNDASTLLPFAINNTLELPIFSTTLTPLNHFTQTIFDDSIGEYAKSAASPYIIYMQNVNETAFFKFSCFYYPASKCHDMVTTLEDSCQLLPSNLTDMKPQKLLVAECEECTIPLGTCLRYSNNIFLEFCNATVNNSSQLISNITNCIDLVLLNQFKCQNISYMDKVNTKFVVLIILTIALWRTTVLHKRLTAEPESSEFDRLNSVLENHGLDNPEQENHGLGSAIIYIWKSKNFACLLCSSGILCCCPDKNTGKRVGHVSMQLRDAQNRDIPNGYISAWPDPDTRDSIRFINNLSADINAEEEDPSQKFIISRLDTNAIHAQFTQIKADGQFKWKLCGSGFFRGTNAINCSGFIADLLLNYGDHGARAPKRYCHRLDKLSRIGSGGITMDQGSTYHYTKLEDIIETAMDKRNLFTSIVRVSLMLVLLVPITLVPFIIIYPLLENDHLYNRPDGSDKGGLSSIDPIDIYNILIPVFIMLRCWLFNVKKNFVFIGNCGGITPDDLLFFFNYLKFYKSALKNTGQEILFNVHEQRVDEPEAVFANSNNAANAVSLATPRHSLVDSSRTARRLGFTANMNSANRLASTTAPSTTTPLLTDPTLDVQNEFRLTS